MATLKGIDVSKHQGVIDWSKPDVDFAIIRAGYGKYQSQTDTQLKANMAGCKTYGIPVGIYWYSYATTVSDAVAEAQTCLAVIKPYQSQIVLPVFFDQEYEKSIVALTNRERTDICKAFCKAIVDAGYKPGIYASFDWFNTKLIVKELGYPFWVAQYGSKCSYAGNNLYMWQYSSKGSVDGISGYVDMDYGYFDLPGVQPAGWHKSGSKWYYYENGQMVKSAWRKLSGKSGTFWYYLGVDGAMLKGEQVINGKRYYLHEQAAGGLPEGALWITDANGVVQI